MGHHARQRPVSHVSVMHTFIVLLLCHRTEQLQGSVSPLDIYKQNKQLDDAVIGKCRLISAGKTIRTP